MLLGYERAVHVRKRHPGRPGPYEGQTKREVYLPAGAEWTCVHDGKVYEGGRTVTVDAPLEVIPVFLKDGKLPELVGPDLKNGKFKKEQTRQDGTAERCAVLLDVSRQDCVPAGACLRRAALQPGQPETEREQHRHKGGADRAV